MVLDFINSWSLHSSLLLEINMLLHEYDTSVLLRGQTKGIKGRTQKRQNQSGSKGPDSQDGLATRF